MDDLEQAYRDMHPDLDGEDRAPRRVRSQIGAQWCGRRALTQQTRAFDVIMRSTERSEP